jgi:hypothetical protein
MSGASALRLKLPRRSTMRGRVICEAVAIDEFSSRAPTGVKKDGPSRPFRSVTQMPYWQGCWRPSAPLNQVPGVQTKPLRWA